MGRRVSRAVPSGLIVRGERDRSPLLQRHQQQRSSSRVHGRPRRQRRAAIVHGRSSSRTHGRRRRRQSSGRQQEVGREEQSRTTRSGRGSSGSAQRCIGWAGGYLNGRDWRATCRGPSTASRSSAKARNAEGAAGKWRDRRAPARHRGGLNQVRRRGHERGRQVRRRRGHGRALVPDWRRLRFGSVEKSTRLAAARCLRGRAPARVVAARSPFAGPACGLFQLGARRRANAGAEVTPGAGRLAGAMIMGETRGKRGQPVGRGRSAEGPSADVGHLTLRRRLTTLM